MNTRTLISSIVLTLGAASGIASAAPALKDGGSLSRVEVRAELTRASAAGEITRNEAWGGVAPVSTLSRADVLAELKLARANDQLADHGEAYGAVQAADFNSTRTRSAVVAEAQSGALNHGERSLYLGGE